VRASGQGPEWGGRQWPGRRGPPADRTPVPRRGVMQPAGRPPGRVRRLRRHARRAGDRIPGAVGAAGQIFRVGHRRIKAGTAVPYGQGAALPVGGKAQPRFPACSRRPQGIGDQIQQHSPQQYCVTACQQGGAGFLISEDHTGPFGQRDHFGGQIPA